MTAEVTQNDTAEHSNTRTNYVLTPDALRAAEHGDEFKLAYDANAKNAGEQRKVVELLHVKEDGEENFIVYVNDTDRASGVMRILLAYNGGELVSSGVEGYASSIDEIDCARQLDSTEPISFYPSDKISVWV